MKNLLFTIRMLKRNPILVYISIPSLAIGLSVVLVLSGYLKYELSYDKHFDTKDRVVRLYSKMTNENSVTTRALTLREAQPNLQQKVPGIEASCQLYRGGRVDAKLGTDVFPALDLLYADPEFFKVFGLKMAIGESESALNGNNKVVITTSAAKRIFGDMDCTGEVVTISDTEFFVSGVIDDLPQNTHFRFDILASIGTIHPEEFGGIEFFSYFLINKNSDVELTGNAIAAEYDKIAEPWGKRINLIIESGTEPVTKLHLLGKAEYDLSPKASLSSIILIGAITFFILLIALVNFVTLYIFYGEGRLQEIGTRKSIGAKQCQIASLFFTDISIIGFLAFCLAIIVIAIIQPVFSNLMESNFSIADLISPTGLALMLGILVMVILITGGYPYLYLARINEVNLMKGRKTISKNMLPAVAVIVQFVVTVFLINSLLIIKKQNTFLMESPIGLTTENVIAIPGISSPIGESFESIKEEVGRLSFIEDIGASYHLLGRGYSGQGIRKYGDSKPKQWINEIRVKPGFCEGVKFLLKEGRFFDESITDKKSIILNESAVKMLGMENPVGKLVQIHKEPLQIIGVVDDFYYNSHPGEPIDPLVITANPDKISALYFRVKDEFSTSAREEISSIINRYDPDFVVNWLQMDDVYADKFYNEVRVMKLTSTGTILAVFLSFIGLMSLSLVTVMKRTKEIGIRKVMGSSEIEIFRTLICKLLILASGAICVSLVANYIVMSDWLKEFTIRIHLHAGYFCISGAFALLIVLFATGWQSWRASTRNPVEALRYE